MEEQLNNLFIYLRQHIYTLIQDKNVDIDALAFDLGIDRQNFIENFNQRIEDFTFYLQTLSLLEKWEV